MAHVFRLYTAGGNDNIEGWNDSNGYGTKAISSISDPEGGSCKREITSIPSPFARIDFNEECVQTSCGKQRPG